jgi:hypothetical protein
MEPLTAARFARFRLEPWFLNESRSLHPDVMVHVYVHVHVHVNERNFNLLHVHVNVLSCAPGLGPA